VAAPVFAQSKDTSDVRRAVRASLKTVAVTDVKTLSDQVDASMFQDSSPSLNWTSPMVCF
jgi:hypothetical protein